MQLLRVLSFFIAHHDIYIKSTHIAGTLNISADHISQFDMPAFFSLNPKANKQPTPLPQPLLQLLSATRPDWTSPVFRKLFTDTLTGVYVTTATHNSQGNSYIRPITFMITCTPYTYDCKHSIMYMHTHAST